MHTFSEIRIMIGRTLLSASVILLIAIAGPTESALAGTDLTPSVNYFNFDYGAIQTSDELDSIVAGRYEALVADLAYSGGYIDKYNDLIRYDPNMQF